MMPYGGVNKNIVSGKYMCFPEPRIVPFAFRHINNEKDCRLIAIALYRLISGSDMS